MSFRRYFRIVLMILCYIVQGEKCISDMINWISHLENIEIFWTNNKRNEFEFLNYVSMLSGYMSSCHLDFRIISAGACDGLADKLLREHYSSEHWNGVMIEGNIDNIIRLNEHLKNSNATNRTLVVAAALMGNCKAPSVEFARPNIKALRPDLSHWILYERGRIIRENRNKYNDIKKDSKWIVENITCKSPVDIYSLWDSELMRRSVAMDSNSARRRRVHALKIDVEHASLDVLRAFLNDDLSNNQIPLLVMAEVDTPNKRKRKQFSDQDCKDAEKFLTSRGYAVSKCEGGDIFGILRPEFISTKSMTW